jgi:outer membrane beta-barrel protein
MRGQFLSTCALFVGSVIALPHLAFCEDLNFHLPPSTIEEFKSDSNYGAPVSVLNPLFPRESKLSLGVGGVASTLSSLYNYFGVSGGVVYHINQRHWIEPLWASYNQSIVTPFVTDEVRDKVDSGTRGRLALEFPRLMVSSSYLFSPYYTKMQISPQSVAHFDVYFGAGLAWVRSQVQDLNGLNTNTQDAMGGVGIAGLRLLFGPRYAVRAEMRDFVYPSTNLSGKEVIQNLQMNLGLEVFFGAFPQL